MRPRTGIDPATGRVQRSKIVRTSRCGKQSYSSPKIAKAKAKASSKMSGEHIEAYHCIKPGCHAWHIGHPPKRLAKAS